MHPNRSCDHTALVVGQHCRVEQCSHGHVHVTLGDLTLRLRPGDFIATAAALEVAARRLDTSQLESSSTTRLLC